MAKLCVRTMWMLTRVFLCKTATLVHQSKVSICLTPNVKDYVPSLRIMDKINGTKSVSNMKIVFVPIHFIQDFWEIKNKHLPKSFPKQHTKPSKLQSRPLESIWDTFRDKTIRKLLYSMLNLTPRSQVLSRSLQKS